MAAGYLNEAVATGDPAQQALGAVARAGTDRDGQRAGCGAKIRGLPPRSSAMATDWVALVTEPAAEYLAATELQRFGLAPFLPQMRRRWRSPHGKAVLRRFPLFPRYLLLRIDETAHPALRIARGLRKARPILADDLGRPWRCPHAVIDAIMLAERRGEFDEIIARATRSS